MIAEMKIGDEKESVATAEQLLATSGQSDPERVLALDHLVFVKAHQAQSSTNQGQSLEEAKRYSEVGMQTLAHVSKPENYTDEQFEKLKSDASALFHSVLSARSAATAQTPQTAQMEAKHVGVPVLKKETHALGPFGFQMGMTREQIIKLVGKSAVDQEYSKNDVLAVRRAPVSDPAFEEYELVISPTEGLLQVSALGKTIKTDSFGTELRVAYMRIVTDLTSKYGKAQLIPSDGCILHPKNEEEILNECREPDAYLSNIHNGVSTGRLWNASLKTGVRGVSWPDGVVFVHIKPYVETLTPFDPRIASSVYRTTGLVIQSGSGYVEVDYAFKGYDEYLVSSGQFH